MTTATVYEISCAIKRDRKKTADGFSTGCKHKIRHKKMIFLLLLDHTFCRAYSWLSIHFWKVWHSIPPFIAFMVSQWPLYSIRQSVTIAHFTRRHRSQVPSQEVRQRVTRNQKIRLEHCSWSPTEWWKSEIRKSSVGCFSHHFFWGWLTPMSKASYLGEK